MNASEDMLCKLQNSIDLLHRYVPNSIGDLFAFQVLSCDSGGGEYRFLCHTSEWMCNASGTLHGGISTAILDQAMGYVVHCMLSDEAIAPSIQLQTVFHKPLIPGRDAVVTVRAVSTARTLISMSAEAADAEHPERICISGTGIYFRKANPAQNAH